MDKLFLCCRQHCIVMLLFADDCICYREIKDKEDTVNSSKTLIVYEVGTGLQPVKCNMMQKWTRSKNIQESFTLDGTVLTVYRRKGSYRFKTAFPEPYPLQKRSLFAKNILSRDSDVKRETDDSLLLAYPGPCNVEIRDGTLTQQEFLDKYAFSKPVIIQGATDNSDFHQLCARDSMINKYGNKKIILSSANTYSYAKRDVTLQYYVDEVMRPQELTTLGNETFYWFGDNNYTEWEELFNQYNPPPYRLPYLTGAYSFGVAGAGTGVPFHFHGPGFGEVIYGRKRWFLYPPDKQPSFNPNKTTLQWLHEDYNNLHPSDRPLECTINQGEVIYFPDRWWHGTLNIDTSVFISTFLG